MWYHLVVYHWWCVTISSSGMYKGQKCTKKSVSVPLHENAVFS